MANLSIVIPNFNGASLLRQYLPSILQAADRAGVSRVLLVDDASQDDSLEVATGITENIQILERKTNGGFGETVNTGAGLVDTNLMAVLMTDIQLEPDSLVMASRVFEGGDDIFAAGLDLRNDESGGNSGVICLPFRRGLFHTSFPDVECPGTWNREACNIAFAMGGAMIVRKDYFDRMGGFSGIYSPYFWEDVDIGWRAWKMGLRSLSVPGALAWHRHPHKTIESSEKKQKIEQVVFRNRMRFIEANITDGKILRQHRFWKLLMMLKRRMDPRDPFVAACREVSRNCPRPKNDGKARVSDWELKQFLDQPRKQGQLPWLKAVDG